MYKMYQVLEYLKGFPTNADTMELKNQLTAFTYQDLHNACRYLNLAVSKKQQKKSGVISVLASHWKTGKTVVIDPMIAKETLKSSSEVPVKHSMEFCHDVVHFVQLFPSHGHVKELQDQLNACRAKTLRSACVLLKLHPKKTFTKSDLQELLVSYWQHSLALTPKTTLRVKERHATLRKEENIEKRHATSREEEKEKDRHASPREEETRVMHTKRPRTEERDMQDTMMKRNVKHEAWKSRGGIVEAMAASLEKAKVVKEWAFAIEILSRVDGSTESISSIRKLIDGVINSAT